MTRLPSGTPVRLPDGTEALCYPDCGIGRPFDGRYVTVQRNPVTGGDRRDHGWTREQLTVIDLGADHRARQLAALEAAWNDAADGELSPAVFEAAERAVRS